MSYAYYADVLKVPHILFDCPLYNSKRRFLIQKLSKYQTTSNLSNIRNMLCTARSLVIISPIHLAYSCTN